MHHKTTLLSGILLICLLLSGSAMASDITSSAANMTYTGIYPDKTLHLKNGAWQGKPYMPGAAVRPRVGLIKDFSFRGDLNHDGQPEQIVFLWESSGGSGTRVYMAVNTYHNGHWINLATTLVGDRVQLQMGRVNRGKIELDVIQAGENDAACCPTHRVVRSWSLKDNQLMEHDPLLLGQISVKDLQGPKWQLLKLNWQEKIPADMNIFIQFDDHKVSGQSACNRFTTTIKEGKLAGEISFGPIAATRKFCDPHIMELEDRFLNALKHVRGFGFINGQLTLEWQDDSAVSTLFFKAVL